MSGTQNSYVKLERFGTLKLDIIPLQYWYCKQNIPNLAVYFFESILYVKCELLIINKARGLSSPDLLELIDNINVLKLSLSQERGFSLSLPLESIRIVQVQDLGYRRNIRSTHKS